MKEKFLLSVGGKHSFFSLSKKAPTENPEMRLIPYFTAGLFILFSKALIPTNKRRALRVCSYLLFTRPGRLHARTTASTGKGLLNEAYVRVSLHLCSLSQFQRKTEGSFLKTFLLFIRTEPSKK